MSFFKLFRNAELYTPEKKGVCDVLVAGDKIAAVDSQLSFTGIEAEEIDAAGRIMTPGFIDRHVHIIGGGGQQGFSSLVPAVEVRDLVNCGTTTVVGVLGTDGFVKDLPALYAKAKAIDQDGLTAYMLTNFYGLPERTLTGSVAEDLIYIDKVIGCKLAMSDDRSSFPQKIEILRLVNQVRIGGFTSGKGGFLHIHIGKLDEGIRPIIEICKEYPSIIGYFSPTHMVRTENLFMQAMEFALMGGNVDFSTGGTRFKLPHFCVMDALEKNVPIERITFSSDGNGGVRKENRETGEVSYNPAPLDLNFKEIRALVKECDLPLEEALKLITSNPAAQMHLFQKGRIAVGNDADFCILNDDLDLSGVIAKGTVFMDDGKIIRKGRYEK